MGLELGGIGFWTYPSEPPIEPYAYIPDDAGIIFNPESLWPFWTPPTQFNRHKSSPTCVRLSPDTYFQSWSQEYVLVGDESDQTKCGVSFHISMEPKGAGRMVAHGHATFDLQTFEICELVCCSKAVDQARAKLQKVINFIRQSQQEARDGMERPVIAQDLKARQLDVKRSVVL